MKKSMLNSAEHDFFFLFIKVKIPTNVGILLFMSRKNSILLVYLNLKKVEFLDSVLQFYNPWAKQK